MRFAARTFLLLSALAAFAGTPPSADSLLDQAKTQAAGQRAIFAIFHASWCGWCHKLDAFLASPDIQPIIDKHFVTVRFTVLENGDKKPLDTPGGDELMKRLGGAGAGLPFVAFLNSDGKMMANTIEQDKNGHATTNIGYPSEAHEVDWFLTMLDKAVPTMAAADRATIEKYLRTPKK